MSTLLEARDVVVRRGSSIVLHQVSLSVPAGTVVALLGANGSGKSSFVRAAVGLLPLTSGSLEVLGEPVGRLRQRRRLGYVPQRTTASAGVPATASEVVAAGLLALPRRERDSSRVTAALQAVELAGRADQPVAELSGGQQQRVLLARALVHDPELLLMDEPMAGVDLESQDHFAETLRGLVDRGCGVLLVAHELGPVAPVIDRAVVLRAGHVVHDGAPPEPVGEHAHPHHDHVHPHADHGSGPGPFLPGVVH